MRSGTPDRSWPPRAVSRVVDVEAELVATVLVVRVAVGDVVVEGDEVLVLESMKMEIPVLAPATGRVASIAVGPGDVVRDGDVLAGIARD